MPSKRQNKKVKKFVSSLKKIRISDVEKTTPRGSVMNARADPQVEAKWPKLKMKVPPIYLHRVESYQPFTENAKDIAQSGIKFYFPKAVQCYIRIDFPTIEDHKLMAQYFDRKNWPYHTYGFPNKRKMKVMITGLPNDTDLDIVKEDLKKLAIPVVRIHKLHTRDDSIRPLIVMVVVPNALDGKEIFKIKKVLGHEVILEPPKEKPRQCYRCQKWGHSQRYCRGRYKCVKCAGEHSYKKCTKTPTAPPKCANCEGEHTANFKGCNYSPYSAVYKQTFALKKATMAVEAAERAPDPLKGKLLSAELLKEGSSSVMAKKKRIIIRPPPGELPRVNRAEIGDIMLHPCELDGIDDFYSSDVIDDFYPSDVDEENLIF